MELIRTTSDFESFQQNELSPSTMKVDQNPISRLAMALSIQLPSRDAKKMALLINAALYSKEIPFEKIPLVDEDMRDYLLMAFEERILIPVKSRRNAGNSWNWVLRVAHKEKEMFFMPRVAQILFRIARKRGIIDAESAVRAVMSHHPNGFIDETICFLKQIRCHIKSCKVAWDLIAFTAQSAKLTINLYDLVDSCLIAGIINPCSRGAKVESNGWYEFHPCLYWDPQFR